MGNKITRTDFAWTNEDVTHFKRRKEILTKHPEIKSLMVHDNMFKYHVLLVVLLQFLFAYVVSHFDVSWPVLLAMTYVISGTANHSILLAMHEIVHNMAFGYTKPKTNKLFGIFCNLPIGVPFSVAFRNYHLDHHKYQGHEVVDPDLPTAFEARLFDNALGRAVWLSGQAFFYGLRPLLINPKTPDAFELFNIAVQFVFNGSVFYFLGNKALFYLVFGSFMGMGLHPISGHFLSEHYMFERKEEGETFSYYGPLNHITWNVGYHNEHHDFPNIPGSMLPSVRKMAPEYYDNIPHHTSWVKVLWDFIWDPDVGHYARVKRKEAMYGRDVSRDGDTSVCPKLRWRGEKS